MPHAKDPTIPLRGRAEILDRLEVARATELLAVDAPAAVGALLADGLGPRQKLTFVEARAIRSVKGSFDWILVWQESRIGSHAVLDTAVKRLTPDGQLWVVTALRKVQGPRTPAAHRLESADVAKAFETTGLANDREARLSAWHAAHRFTRRNG